MNGVNVCTVVVVLSLFCVLAATDPYVVQDTDFLMVFTSVNLTVRQKEAHEVVATSEFTKVNTATVKANGTDALELTLSFPPTDPSSKGPLAVTVFDLSMSFIQSPLAQYWTLEKASVNLKGSDVAKFDFPNVALFSEYDLTAPLGLSYHCSRFGPLYPSKPEGNHTFFIDLRGFQIQPFANNTKFQEAYECVGFFSIGILSGLFVTIILISVLTWGLAMIMSVKTMDRFDDPKGKPISFGGTE